ncbi:nucleotide-diphospho-sugar transferase [Phakopsora pachyrhizi]|uniref:mannose-1-phosphate guanylyltransferase n=1 Tax=Phakopsora pachyrhizi TaxID=170000 RepID=A0AAV0BKG4_PHAPC|nr:nucleotide-diphospho-sugar transferase [Phakopsora pachyrhizi]CAH7687817.1 nucleotide-diphospho-sugar transferase [Phakopsora pachyrhizi]
MAAAKAVYLLGGPSKGTRMRPLTLDIPKPLFPLAGRAIIWHGIQALSKVSNLKEVLLIGFYEDSVLAPFIKQATRDFPSLQIRYLREYEALGTAGGLYHFRDAILKGFPEQIYVLHSDIASSFPLSELKSFHDRHRGVGTLMGVQVSKELSTRFGCIVTNPETAQALHYVEKPESFLSNTINTGVYLFDKSIFDEIKAAMDLKMKQNADDPLRPQDDQLRLEQDVIAPLADRGKLYVYETKSSWKQIKSAGSALPANALVLESYKSNNPVLLRRRSPTIIAAQPPRLNGPTGPEIVEPCYIDETAVIDPSAKIGPNVSIGANVRIGFGARVRDSIILDNTILEQNCCVLYSILGEDNKIGAWARVEGAPIPLDGTVEKNDISVLAKDVEVKSEVHVRSCIVLPHKSLGRSSAKEVLL